MGWEAGLNNEWAWLKKWPLTTRIRSLAYRKWGAAYLTGTKSKQTGLVQQRDQKAERKVLTAVKKLTFTEVNVFLLAKTLRKVCAFSHVFCITTHMMSSLITKSGPGSSPRRAVHVWRANFCRTVRPHCQRVTQAGKTSTCLQPISRGGRELWVPTTNLQGQVRGKLMKETTSPVP